MMTLDSSIQDRIQRALKRLDPSVRIEHLVQQQKVLQQRFLDVYSDAELQQALLLHKQTNLPLLNLAAMDEEAARRYRAEVEEVEYYARQKWAIVEVIVEELERIERDLEAANNIGLREQSTPAN